jgi:hypothetical protein
MRSSRCDLARRRGEIYGSMWIVSIAGSDEQPQKIP